MRLDELPAEILQWVAHHLNLTDQCALRATCSALAEALPLTNIINAQWTTFQICCLVAHPGIEMRGIVNRLVKAGRAFDAWMATCSAICGMPFLKYIGCSQHGLIASEAHFYQKRSRVEYFVVADGNVVTVISSKIYPIYHFSHELEQIIGRVMRVF